MIKELPPPKEMYQALLNKNPKYEGIFIVGVKTTGIFCRPTCPAKKPKFENVDFFSSTNFALQAGYRPCKRCKPLQEKGMTPLWVEKILKEIDSNPTRKWTDKEIDEFGINPNRLRRWFKKHHDMTFHTYLRLRRLGMALGQIQHGDKISSAAYDNGYDSLSGFREAMKNLIGKPVKKGKNTKIVRLNRITTPLGPMIAGTSNNGLCLLEFTDRRMLETQLNKIKKYFDCAFIPGSTELTQEVNEQLVAYFEGRLKKFSLPLDVPGSEFQCKVWDQLQSIPYGKTRSYSEQAKEIGNPKAVRAVAKANGDNRIAIVIPCHRVIGKDGSLTGYGGGLWRKKHLLKLEKTTINKHGK